MNSAVSWAPPKGIRANHKSQWFCPLGNAIAPPYRSNCPDRHSSCMEEGQLTCSTSTPYCKVSSPIKTDDWTADRSMTM
ncbi:hypothetical protein CK203_078331 [Vitis vinifera]|uniref:Uncharacterized protein n=1 Tax=Vitis vinifera TaxID=29760 RepID=A0A438DXW1_VITVI|nr:hypothetical protein CK203_078331 [Vitis vinifera]